jgi:probable phosphoglycerate mutase
VVRIWLIRHGESESNAGLPSSDPEPIPLTARGRRQAERIARGFTDPPALIVTSRFVRARQTAEPTIGRFPAVPCREWPVEEFTYLGDLHGRVMTAAGRRPHTEAYWSRADPRHAGGGAESFAGLLTRVGGFLDRLAEQPSGPVAVFTHGLFVQAVLWSLLTGVRAPDAEDMRGFRTFADRYAVPNGGIIELRNAGGLVLPSGTTVHLPDA